MSSWPSNCIGAGRLTTGRNISGAFPDSHHHARCPTRAAGRLARIRSRGRDTRAFGCLADLINQSGSSLEQLFETHIQTLALTLRRDTVTNYRCMARRFLRYPRAAFPQVRRLAQLPRDPHLLGWFRWLCKQDPPLCNKTRAHYLLGLRRLLDDLAANGRAVQPDLICREDFPPRPQYLPRPLTPSEAGYPRAAYPNGEEHVWSGQGSGSKLYKCRFWK